MPYRCFTVRFPNLRYGTPPFGEVAFLLGGSSAAAAVVTTAVVVAGIVATVVAEKQNDYEDYDPRAVTVVE